MLFSQFRLTVHSLGADPTEDTDIVACAFLLPRRRVYSAVASKWQALLSPLLWLFNRHVLIYLMNIRLRPDWLHCRSVLLLVVIEYSARKQTIQLWLRKTEMKKDLF
jgi:hypothetical protein